MAPQVEMETVGGLRVRMLRARRESKMGRESKTGRESKMGRESKILFLHGANGFPGWLPMFERLAESHEVWVPEHPGFGASDDAPGLVNVSDFAYYYLDFLERYDLREVHVMGHSLGGWIASEVAVRDCSRFASLTLFAPAGVRIKGIQTGDNFIWAPDEAVRTVFYDQALAERILSRVIGEEEQDQIIRTRLMGGAAGLGAALVQSASGEMAAPDPYPHAAAVGGGGPAAAGGLCEGLAGAGAGHSERDFWGMRAFAAYRADREGAGQA